MLIRQSLGRAIRFGERLLKSSPEPAEIRHMLLRTYWNLAALPAKRRSASLSEDLSATQRLLGQMGWIGGCPSSFRSSSDVPDVVLAARHWRRSLCSKGVLENGRFAVGAGSMLDVLDRFGADEERRFAESQCDRLLRHVEISRRHCLTRSLPALSRPALLLERCEVAILFSRLAVRHRDLRYLNTAFKMNDWFLHRRLDSWAPMQRGRIMRSLAEQEFAAEALL